MDKTFLVSVPSDGRGFIGRACDATECRQYFKIRIPDHKDLLFCPYCGSRFSKSFLLTPEQIDHVRRVAAEEARVYVHSEFQKMLKSVFSGSQIITYTPGPHPVKRAVTPAYMEREVDTELVCSECATQFQVYGIFGYCPGCGYENLRIYDANWDVIKRSLGEAANKKRPLRHAYGDLVSAFEAFCSRKARLITNADGNFQDLFDARKFFGKHANVDILASVSPRSLLALRRVFQKRHVCTHAAGIINERYIRMIPEDLQLLGTEAVLSVSELEIAATAVRTALADLVRSIERPGK